jgi:uncharacterized protein YrrD
MLLLSEKLTGVPIMSLQTGTKLAETTDPIIDPGNLTILASYVDGQSLDTTPSVLFMEDIREAGELGFIIDDSSRLMPLEGLVRLQGIIDEEFSLPGINVVDKRGGKVGKVVDYSFSPEDYIIQQLFVKPGLLQSIVHDMRIINRSQIIDVTSKLITIDTPDVKDSLKDKAEQASNYVNPFRSPDIEAR